MSIPAPTTVELLARIENLLDRCRRIVESSQNDLQALKSVLAASNLTELQRLMVAHGISILEQRLSGLGDQEATSG